MKKNNSYWLFLEPHVRIFIKRDHVLLYDTLKGKVLEYCKDHEISKVAKRLKGIKNLFTIKITGKEINGNASLAQLISDLKENCMGDIIDSSLSRGKPVQLVRILNNQAELKKNKFDNFWSIGEDILANLKEISFFITNRCERDCEICKYAYKQFPFCSTNGKAGEILEVDKIRNFVIQAKGSGLSRINILGGNILSYPELETLFNFLAGIPILKSYFIHVKNLKNGFERIASLTDRLSELEVLIEAPFNKGKADYIEKIVQRATLETCLCLVVKNENELLNIQKYFYSIGPDKLRIQPCFNANNFDFFHEHVFLSKQRIIESSPSEKDIFTRMAANPTNFGKLIVGSNGKIYGNMNNAPIGLLEKDSLRHILYRELDSGKSWRRLRTNVQPCKSCVYNLLCPPLSNYETVLGQNNLCQIEIDP